MSTVLIVEDDLMLADTTEELLVEHGYTVCGIARTVAEGVALGRLHRPDLALVDLRLADGGLGTEVVIQLGDLGRFGVLYATGNAAQLLRTTNVGDACLSKPYSPAALLRGLEIVAEMVATGTASRPFPHGFQLMRPKVTIPKETADG